MAIWNAIQFAGTWTECSLDTGAKRRSSELSNLTGRTGAVFQGLTVNRFKTNKFARPELKIPAVFIENGQRTSFLRKPVIDL